MRYLKRRKIRIPGKATTKVPRKKKIRVLRQEKIWLYCMEKNKAKLKGEK